MLNIAIPEFNPSTFNLTIAKNSPISSEELNGFTQAAASDLQNLSLMINDIFIKLISSLPDYPSINAIDNGIDGANVMVDNDATAVKDSGLFFNTAENRPFTIYEALLFLMQVMANTENGMREGLRVGSYSAPVTINNGAYVEYDWSYTDYQFKEILNNISGNTVSKANVSVTISNLTNKIIITNSSGSAVNIFGYLWHPVLSF